MQKTGHDRGGLNGTYLTKGKDLEGTEGGEKGLGRRARSVREKDKK